MHCTTATVRPRQRATCIFTSYSSKIQNTVQDQGTHFGQQSSLLSCFNLSLFHVEICLWNTEDCQSYMEQQNVWSPDPYTLVPVQFGLYHPSSYSEFKHEFFFLLHLCILPALVSTWLPEAYNLQENSPEVHIPFNKTTTKQHQNIRLSTEHIFF